MDVNILQYLDLFLDISVKRGFVKEENVGKIYTLVEALGQVDTKSPISIVKQLDQVFDLMDLPSSRQEVGFLDTSKLRDLCEDTKCACPYCKRVMRLHDLAPNTFVNVK